MAGLCGLVMAVLADISVSGFYGWPVMDHLPISVGIAAAGFVAVFCGYKLAARKSRRARAIELRGLDGDAPESETTRR